MTRTSFRRAFDGALGSPPLAALFRACDWLIRTILRVWGHWRRAALFRSQGAGCVCHWNCEIKYPDRIQLGERVIIGVNAVLGGAGGIILGNDVRISREAILETAGLDFKTGKPPYRHVSKPILIEDGAWIGTRAIILGGVTIGRNAVVAAGALVNRDVEAFTTVAGVPARLVSKVQAGQ